MARGEDLSSVNILLESKDKPEKCGLCEEKIDACDDFYCSDCQHWLCRDCKNQHSKFPTLKAHRITASPPINQTPTYPVCKQHSPFPLKYYCIQCSEKTCAECQATDHWQHEKSTLDKKIEELTESLAKAIQESEALSEKYEGTIEELLDYKEEFEKKVKRMNKTMNDQKEQLINSIFQKYKDAKQKNDDRLAALTEKIDAKIAEVQQHLADNNSQLNDLQTCKSALNVHSDIASIDFPEVSEVEFEKPSHPLTTCCIGSCVTEGTIRCTVNNIKGMEVECCDYYSPNFEIRGLPWCVSVDKDEKPDYGQYTLRAFLSCSESSTEKSWSVKSSCTFRLLHPHGGQTKAMYSDPLTYTPDNTDCGDAIHDWKAMIDEGYVTNGSIQVEVEIRPDTEQGVEQCTCSNKRVWNTEINIPKL